MKIIVVVSVFNEEGRIGDLISKLEKKKYPIIVVDDGSTDSSRKVIQRSKASKLTLVSHKINLGKGAAMKTGTIAAFKLGADAVIFMDGDGQHDVKDLRSFQRELENEYQVIFGQRNPSKDTPTIRKRGNDLASFIVRTLFSIEVNDLLCGYRAITKKAFEEIEWKSVGYQVETEMVIRTAKSKLSYSTIPVRTLYHDKYKGFTILDGFRILLSIIRWRLII